MLWFAGTTAATAATASCCSTAATQSDLAPSGAMASTNESFLTLGIILLLPLKVKTLTPQLKQRPPGGMWSPDGLAGVGPDARR